VESLLPLRIYEDFVEMVGRLGPPPRVIYPAWGKVTLTIHIHKLGPCLRVALGNRNRYGLFSWPNLKPVGTRESLFPPLKH